MISQRKSATQYSISLQKQKICNEKLMNVADMHSLSNSATQYKVRCRICDANFPFFCSEIMWYRCEILPCWLRRGSWVSVITLQKKCVSATHNCNALCVAEI